MSDNMRAATTADFEEQARNAVAAWLNEHVEEAYKFETEVEPEQVYVMDSSACLGNWTGTLRSDRPRGIGWSFDVTFDAREKKLHLEAYRRESSMSIDMGGIIR